jgi:hypothetical protein
VTDTQQTAAEALAEAEQTVRAARLRTEEERYTLAKHAIAEALTARGLPVHPLQQSRWASQMRHASVTGPRSRAR